jgi:dihydrofolate reductase
MISIVVVVGKNREIGCDNKLLWKLPKDMQRFKDLTMGHTVVMGEKTFESIGRALPGRKNVVLSLQKNYQAAGCEVKNSVGEFLQEAKKSEEEVFIIGGGTIYDLVLPFTDKLYLTIIDDEPQADTFFADYADFKNVIKKEEGFDNGFKYQYLELTR